ncbi:MAG TPA: M23 family metallopeptidase [Flavipsychrobacter sp.]|nr:M23 family metallopeptidase [Flavipsychrobacter sp.]
MLVYLLLAASILFALTSLLFVWKASQKLIAKSWSTNLLAISIAVFIYLYGTWVYLSVYTKYVFGVLFLLILLMGFAKKKKEIGNMQKWKVIPNLIFSVLFISLSVLYFTGTTGKPETVALPFPLKKDNYFILQGGKGLPSNFFHYSYRGAIYAIDIVRLNNFGNRANKIFSSRLEDYHIYNDTIFSPCNGIITRARDENPDNIPPDRTRGPSNTNSVVIETDSFYVFMAHLKYKGVFVLEGDIVKTGQPIGLVGNSGFTLEPHLHIQAHKNTGKDGWYREDPLYIEFDGRSYLLFETIRPKRVRMVEE